MKFQLASLDNQNVLLGPEPKYIVNSFVCVEAGVDERLTPRPPDPGFKPRPSRCFLRQGTLLQFFSLHPGVLMGTGDILLGGNPAMN